MYLITIIVHSEMESGSNPEFQFIEKEAAYAFVEICLDNGFLVEIGKVK